MEKSDTYIYVVFGPACIDDWYRVKGDWICRSSDRSNILVPEEVDKAGHLKLAGTVITVTMQVARQLIDLPTERLTH